MAEHRVKASMKVLEIAQAGSALELKVFADDEIIGTIQIGHGSFRWKGKNRKGFKRISWSRFADLMDDYHYE